MRNDMLRKKLAINKDTETKMDRTLCKRALSNKSPGIYWLGREVGGRIGMGKTCEPKAFSFQCMTKFTTKKKKQDSHLLSHSWEAGLSSVRMALLLKAWAGLLLTFAFSS